MPLLPVDTACGHRRLLWGAGEARAWTEGADTGWVQSPWRLL